MTLNFNPANDLAILDATETVTLERRATPLHDGTVTRIIVTHALRAEMKIGEPIVSSRRERRRQEPTDGRYLAYDVVWHLPTNQLDEPPCVGDRILDAVGRSWTILDTKSVTLNTRWCCTCRYSTIADELDNSINVLKAVDTKGECGAVVRTWRRWRTAVRAKIQPVENKAVAEHDAVGTTRRYRIFLAEDLALDHTHRIEGPDGAVYEIIQSTGYERLDQVAVLEAEKVG